MTFREKLIALRARDNLTQTGLARAVGVTRQAVYMWEKGQSYPEAETLLALRRLFGVSVDELLDDALPLPEGRTNYASPAAKEPPKPAAPRAAGTKPATPAPVRFEEAKPKTPSNGGENVEPPTRPARTPGDQREPLRAKVEPSRERRSGTILDLFGSLLRRKK